MGELCRRGVFAAQPRRDKFALGVVLLAGIATAWFALVVVAAQLTLSRSASWTYYGIDAQGQILAISEEYGAVVKVTTPDGAEPPQYQDAKARNALRGHLLPTARVWPNWDEGGGYQNCDHYFFPLYVPGDLAWYYVRDAGPPLC